MLTNPGHTRKESNAYRIALLCLASFLLISGGMVYLAFRSISLRMFGWFEALGMMDGVEWIRMMSSGWKPGGFVLYNLPDLLWLTSYLVFVNAIIPKRERRSYLFWSLSMPLLAVLHEIMQAAGIANGSFDCMDLLCYIIPTVINIIINHNIFFTDKTTEPKKSNTKTTQNSITNLTHFTYEEVI